MEYKIKTIPTQRINRRDPKIAIEENPEYANILTRNNFFPTTI